MLEELYNYLKSGNIEKASKIVFSDLKDNVIGLILVKAKIKNKSEALTILSDALYYVHEKIIANKFVFKNEKGFLSYFKKACAIKAYEYNKLMNGNSKFIVSNEILEQHTTDFEDEFKKNKAIEYRKKKELYGIEIETEENELSKEYIAAFHKLSEKCKMLLVLKQKHTYKEIMQMVGILYKIVSLSVCKSTYWRCKNNLKKKLNK